jgi:murein DD-endopeptidase MepM/ murein hydrolase activator NlpD
MKIIFLGGARTRSLHLSRRLQVALVAVFCALPLGAGLGLGHALASLTGAPAPEARIDDLRDQVAAERERIAAAEAAAHQRLQAITLKLAELQSRALRLDALGERMVEVAGMDPEEFGFGRPPAQGGPEQLPQQPPALEFDRLFAELDARLEEREQQLRLLGELTRDRRLERESTLTGYPVAKGWISSSYGYRVDPFNGRRAWHGGVDFAGRAGSPVVAVAAGVVTRAGRDGAYGNSVQIDHGDGLVTRYSHNRENLVTVGELVKKGQPIATMGSTGRASGPHVHFEVTRDGRSLNPAPYIQRAAR